MFLIKKLVLDKKTKPVTWLASPPMPNCNSFAALPIYIMFTLHNNAKMLKWYVAYDGGGRTLHETFAVLLYMPAGKKTCYFNLFFFAMKYEKKKSSIFF